MCIPDKQNAQNLYAQDDEFQVCSTLQIKKCMQINKSVNRMKNLKYIIIPIHALKTFNNV